MPYSETHTAIVSKPAQRQLREKVLANNVEAITETMNTRATTVRGWHVAVIEHRSGQPWRQRSAFGTDYADSAEYVYEIHYSITFTREDDTKPEPQELGAIVRRLATKVVQPTSGRWQLTSVDGKPYVPAGDSGSDEDGDNVGYAPVEIPEDWDDHFSHLFGLDAQITRVLRAIEAGVLSDWNNRYHCALVGPPGCGKSDVCQSIKRALGEDAVMEFDATATTAAGAIKDLSEREILPRIILIEEIEKAPEQAMSFLLGVLDLRSQIRKTTARSTVVRDTKMFAIATVNDVALFEKLQAGALASRFANRISFKRPSREQLSMILKREVKRMNGDLKWIKPTLDYCEKVGINDPRRVTAVCLCGREMLLTGEYQQLLSDTTMETV